MVHFSDDWWAQHLLRSPCYSLRGVLALRGGRGGAGGEGAGEPGSIGRLPENEMSAGKSELI